MNEHRKKRHFQKTSITPVPHTLRPKHPTWSSYITKSPRLPRKMHLLQPSAKIPRLQTFFATLTNPCCTYFKLPRLPRCKCRQNLNFQIPKAAWGHPSSLEGGPPGGGWLAIPFPNNTFSSPSFQSQKRKKLPLCSYARLSAKRLSARGQFRAQNEAYARSKSGYARLSAKRLSARGA